MLATAVTLTALEHTMPPLALLPPNVKLGLSNIVIMYCVFFVGGVSAVTINALKSFFVFLTRGPQAGLLSFGGGMLSVCVIILLIVLFKDKISYAGVSVAGAVTHNLGQLIVFALLTQTAEYVAYYIPQLLVAGVVTGIITGLLLKVILPVFRRVLKE